MKRSALFILFLLLLNACVCTPSELPTLDVTSSVLPTRSATRAPTITPMVNPTATGAAIPTTAQFVCPAATSVPSGNDVEFVVGSMREGPAPSGEYEGGQTIEILAVRRSGTFGGQIVAETLVGEDNVIYYRKFSVDSTARIPDEKFGLLRGTVFLDPDPTLQVMSWTDLPPAIESNVNTAQQEVRALLSQHADWIVEVLKQSFGERPPENFPYEELFSDETAMGTIALDLSGRAVFDIGVGMMHEGFMKGFRIQVVYDLCDRRAEKVYLSYVEFIVGP